jgi:predicted cupin superfamily sugar epimerase
MPSEHTLVADEVISRFSLKPHPFDGWYAPVETARDAPVRFHYMLRTGEYAHWHQTAGKLILTLIDGAPLTVSWSEDGKATANTVLQADSASSVLIDKGAWRSWESLGTWSLLIASVERAEDFLRWQLAPDHWFPAA